MTLVEEIDKAIQDKTFFEWLYEKLEYRWSPALLSLNVTPGIVRLQLQSAPPGEDDTGEIRCVEGRNILEAVQAAMRFAGVPNGQLDDSDSRPRTKPQQRRSKRR